MRRKTLIEAGFILLALFAVLTQPAGVVRDLAHGQAAWAMAAGVSVCWAAALLCGLTLRLAWPGDRVRQEILIGGSKRCRGRRGKAQKPDATR